jgi:hypothetical protein
MKPTSTTLTIITLYQIKSDTNFFHGRIENGNSQDQYGINIKEHPHNQVEYNDDEQENTGWNG